MSEDFIRFENVKKVYHTGEVELTALHDVSFSVARGEICIIVGESGAGKTTLLNILGGMDCLTEGRITVDGSTAVMALGVYLPSSLTLFICRSRLSGSML